MWVLFYSVIVNKLQLYVRMLEDSNLSYENEIAFFCNINELMSGKSTFDFWNEITIRVYTYGFLHRLTMFCISGEKCMKIVVVVAVRYPSFHLRQWKLLNGVSSLKPFLLCHDF